MIVLGVSGGHDANWCVVRDGIVLGAFEKERFTGIRHDGGEVLSLIPATLTYLSLTIEDVDLVATSEPVHRDTDSGLRRIGGNRYRAPDKSAHQVVECLGRVLPCVSVPHHLSHAAYARYACDAEDLTVITWDGGGDFYTEDAHCATSVSRWNGSNMSWFKRLRNSDLGSLWFTYSRAVFGDGNHAGKLMGLSALGTDRLVQDARDLFLRPAPAPFDSAVTVKDCWPDYDAPPLTRRLGDWRDPQAADIARAVQTVTTEACLSLAESVSQVVGGGALALSGGVALNGYANNAVQRSGSFDSVFVPPAVHDGGIALGAALFATHHVLQVPRPAPEANHWDFLGMGYGRGEVERALQASGLRWRPVVPEEAEALAVEALLSERVIAWYSGRSEHGPRALGNRSILALPHFPSIRDRINRSIKFREPFRPLAPVVPVGSASRWFDVVGPSPWMMHIVDTLGGLEDKAPSAVHADGTARVQTVDATSVMGRLAETVGERTGLPMLLNTSLNVKTPIVNDPSGALSAFAEVPIDLLFLEGCLVEKQSA